MHQERLEQLTALITAKIDAFIVEAQSDMPHLTKKRQELIDAYVVLLKRCPNEFAYMLKKSVV